MIQYSRQSRAERLIAGGRAVLAGAVLVATWLDPWATRGQSIAHAILALYVAYAAILAGLTWRTDPPPRRLQLTTHVFDLGLFAALVYFAEAPAGSFFMLFVFSMAAATLRWGWPGSLWTGSAAVLVFLTVGVSMALGGPDFRIEVHPFVVRSMYLAVIAILLGYVGAYEHRLRGEMARLAAWPATLPRDGAALIGETLAHAAATMEAPRALLVWDDPEEPWRYVAAWSCQGLQWTREAPDTFEPIIVPAFESADFLCTAAGVRGTADPPSGG